MTQKKHWEKVYSDKPSEKLGWYKPHLQTSLTWIKELGLGADAPIIDVGGGASTLVDDLLDAGYRSITVLDMSEKALSSVRARLGKKADLVTWLNGDITSADLPALWQLPPAVVRPPTAHSACASTDALARIFPAVRRPDPWHPSAVGPPRQ